MNNIKRTLQDFGLTSNEIKIYLEAIKHEEISPFKLAKLTGIPRTTVYDVMTTLALKDLITLKTSQGLEKQQTWVIAKNPSTLREIILKRRTELTRLEVDVVDILSELKKEYLQEKPNADFTFYPGIKGAREVYEKINLIPSKVPIYMLDHMLPMDTLGKEFVNKLVVEFLAFRRKNHLQIQTIMPLNNWTKHVLSYQYGRDKHYLDTHNFRYLDDSRFNLGVDFYMYSDRLAIISAKDDETWGLIVKSKLLTLSMRSIFEMLWTLSVPVTPTIISSWGENEFLREERLSIRRQSKCREG